MLINKVGMRGVLLTFEDNISVYLINTEKRIFLCDTHLGPESMKLVNDYIHANFEEKEIVVFNTHSDWDHIWGNSFFAGSLIIAHEKCRERIIERGKYDLEKNSDRQKGHVQLKLPNLTFKERLSFPDEEIEFLYQPGHTIDSAICCDTKDSVIFVGDLVEDPIPYLSYPDLETYLNTLNNIREKPALIKISSHSGIIDEHLITRNECYLRSIMEGRPVASEDEELLNLHNYNLKNLLLLKYETVFRQKQKNRFDFNAFRKNYRNLENFEYHQLEKSLESFLTESL